MKICCYWALSVLGRPSPAPQVLPLQDLQHPRALQGMRDWHGLQGKTIGSWYKNTNLNRCPHQEMVTTLRENPGLNKYLHFMFAIVTSDWQIDRLFKTFSQVIADTG